MKISRDFASFFNPPPPPHPHPHRPVFPITFFFFNNSSLLYFRRSISFFFYISHNEIRKVEIKGKGNKIRKKRKRARAREIKLLLSPFLLLAQQRLPLLLALPRALPLRSLQTQLLALEARERQGLDHGLGDGEPRRLPVERVPRRGPHPLARLVRRRLQQSVEIVRGVGPVDQPPWSENREREPRRAQEILCGLFAGQDGEEVEDRVRELVGALFSFFVFCFVEVGRRECQRSNKKNKEREDKEGFDSFSAVAQQARKNNEKTTKENSPELPPRRPARTFSASLPSSPPRPGCASRPRPSASGRCPPASASKGRPSCLCSRRPPRRLATKTSRRTPRRGSAGRVRRTQRARAPPGACRSRRRRRGRPRPCCGSWRGRGSLADLFVEFESEG